MAVQKVVLVTGASSGAGQATARLLAQRGYRVFGTSRSPAGGEVTPGLEMLSLDVRADASVAACIDAVSSRAGRLDVLVNNAGYELAGALEELSLEEARSQFETNFFGVVRMVKAVLPLMRQQKEGWIINVSSLSGISPIPFMGMYSASKFAVEGYTEVLRQELKPFNIHVSQIEPGFLKTPMMNHRQVAAQTIGAYDPCANGHTPPSAGMKSGAQVRSSSLKPCSRLSRAPLQGCATLSGARPNCSLACAGFCPRGRMNRGPGRPSSWTRNPDCVGPSRRAWSTDT